MKHSVIKAVLTACLIVTPVTGMATDTVAPPPVNAEKTSGQTTVPVVAKLSKIGSFDISYIGRESDFSKSVKAQLNEKKVKFEAKITAEKKKLDALKESIESKLPSYTPKQREAKSKDFQKKVEAFQNLVRESEESFMKEQDGETGKIFSLIEKTVSDYGKSNDYALIAIKKDILYIGNGIEAEDLTSIILKAVNDSWKKK